MLYLLRPYTRINCGKLADALAPLVVFHFAYGLVTMLIYVVIDVYLYRILLWYFAVYPAAIAAAVAGGGRLATLVAAAVYLAAYVIGVEPLLLLLAAILAGALASLLLGLLSSGVVARAYGLFYAL